MRKTIKKLTAVGLTLTSVMGLVACGNNNASNGTKETVDWASVEKPGHFTIMVDGTGMCGACRLQVGDEIKFACVDGPEFDGHLVDFDQAMKRQQMYKTEEGRAMLKLQEGDTHHGGCGNCND